MLRSGAEGRERWQMPVRIGKVWNDERHRHCVGARLDSLSVRGFHCEQTRRRLDRADARRISCCSIRRCSSPPSGNTALQSVMPAIGREIGIGDFWVAIAYTWSAVLWVALAPYWAEKSDHHGRKTLTIMGVTGFIVSMLLCGIRIVRRPEGLDRRRADVRPLRASSASIYGGFGCATPSATQAYLASKTRRSGRVAALSALSSLVRPGHDHRPGRSRLCSCCRCSGLPDPCSPSRRSRSPSFSAILLWLPNDRLGTQGRARRGDELSVAGAPRRPAPASSPQPLRAARKRLKWNDPRIRSWIIAGVAAGHAQAATLTCLGFFIIDRLHLAPLGIGRTDRHRHDGRRSRDSRRAMGPHPAARPGPARADPVGCADRRGRASPGPCCRATSTGSRSALRSPRSASASPGPDSPPAHRSRCRCAEQGGVAGVITAANGISYVLAPTIGIGLYGSSTTNLPFAAFALLLLGLAAFGREPPRSGLGRFLRRRTRAEHAREGRSRFRPGAASPRSSACPGCAHIPRASRA